MWYDVHGAAAIGHATLAMAALPVVPLPDAYWRERGPFLARLHAAHGPVVRALLGQTEVVFLLGPAANRCVLQTQRRSFAHHAGWDWVFGRPSSPPNLLTMDDPEHTWHRRLLHPTFAAHRLDHTLPLITRVVDRRLATWAARGTVDIYEEARVVALDVVAEVVLGLRAPEERALCRAVFLHGAHHRAGEFAALLRRTSATRRVHQTDDALGVLAWARDEWGHPLDDAQIRAHAEVMLIAGHETTASLAAWALYLLVQHPAWADRVRAELAGVASEDEPGVIARRGAPALDRALREAERLYPPVSVAPRVVCEDAAVEGYALPAGTRVLYSAAATHLLPEFWADQMRFDPDRFAPPRAEHRAAPYALVGFGGGPRVCIGRSLARLELAVLLARALRRYRLTVAPGQTIVQRPGITSRPLRGIRLRVAPWGAAVTLRR